MKIVVGLILFFLSMATCLAQDNLITVKILDSKPMKGEKLRTKLTIECQNLSDTAFVLYGFHSIRRIATKVNEICNYKAKMSAAMALYVYDASMKKMGDTRPLIPRELDYKPITEEMLDSVIRTSRRKYLLKTEAIGKRETKQFEVEVDLEDFRFSSGTYYMQLVYFSGDQITAMVNLDQINADCEKYNAVVYRGCVPTNVISLEFE